MESRLEACVPKRRTQTIVGQRIGYVGKFKSWEKLVSFYHKNKRKERQDNKTSFLRWI